MFFIQKILFTVFKKFNYLNINRTVCPRRTDLIAKRHVKSFEIGGVLSKGWCETTIPPETSVVLPHPCPFNRLAV